jgi:hypothetical protein
MSSFFACADPWRMRSRRTVTSLESEDIGNAPKKRGTGDGFVVYFTPTLLVAHPSKFPLRSLP